MNDLLPFLVLIALVQFVAIVLLLPQKPNSPPPQLTISLPTPPAAPSGGCGPTLFGFLLLSGAAVVLLFLR